jgi:hypothetical protein
LQGVTSAAPASRSVADTPIRASVARAAPEFSKGAQAVDTHAAQRPAADRAAAEQKIAAEHSWCMRAKPKYECEQARARALSALDKPAVKPVKVKRPAKASTTAKQVTANAD